MKSLLFFCLAFLVGVPQMRAQALEGRVTDAETGEALIGATIFLPSLQRGTATDAAGRYRVEDVGAGTHRVVFSFIGFQNETRTVSVPAGGLRLDVALTPTTLEAAPITITAKAQASDILSTPQAVSILEGPRLMAQQGAAAFDALGHTAGVHLLRTGSGVAKPMVRGLTAQRVLIVQNGVRQEGQQWGDEHGPELDAFDMARIEVVKGPASLLYGSDALGGVIQATSGDLFAYDVPLAGAVGLQAMSNAPLGAGHLLLGGRRDGLAYEGALTHRQGGSYDTPAGVVPNTGLEETHAALRVGRRMGGGQGLAEYQHSDSRIGLFEPEAALDGDPRAGRFAIGEPYQRVLHDRFRFDAVLPWDRHRVAVTAAWQQNDRREYGHHDEEQAAHKVAADAPEEGEHEGPALHLRLRTLTADVRLHHRPVGPVFGTIGFSGLVQNNETLAEESLIPGARTFNAAVYVFEELMLPRLTLSGGLRLDARRLEVDANADLRVNEQTRTYQALSGAAGLAWQPRSVLSLALNVGRAWRAPVLVELFAEGVHEGSARYERGAPTLTPEQSLSLDGTVRWLNRHAYVEVSGFVNHIDDYIFPRPTNTIEPTSGFFLYQYDQAAARLWGGEVTADIHPHPLDWMHLRLAGDVTWTTNLDTGDPLPFSPPPRLRAELELEGKNAGPFTELRASFGPTFVGRQDRIAPSETPTPGYTLWGVSMSAEIAAGGVVIMPVLGVDNLFDKTYIAHLSRLKPYDVLNPGRSVRMQVRVTFGH